MSEQSDHDIIVVLVERVNNLIQSQSDFHKIVNANFEELKNNYSSRIDGHEDRIGKLEKGGTKTSVMLSIGISILGILVGLLTWHIVK